MRLSDERFAATVRREVDIDRVMAAAYGWLKKADLDSGGYEVTIKRPRRSNAQNRYLWGVVYKTLAEGLSERSGELVKPSWVHDLCKQHFTEPQAVPGTDETVPGSTTQLTRRGWEQSFQEYVLNCQRLAAEYGIYIPDPEEDRYGV